MDAIKIEGLTKKYKDVVAVDALTLSIRQGELFSLLGINGAGKTTLIKLMTRLYDPTEGSILLDGKDLREYDTRDLYSIFGIIFQDFGRYAYSVRDNIRFGDVARDMDDSSLESAAKSVSQLQLQAAAPIRDTVIIRDTVEVVDTLRLFRWQDSWVTIDGVIERDSVVCNLRSVDTLRQTIYRVPRRFWFIKFGTKALRQHIVSSNPHSEIIYTEYVKIEK